MCFPFLFDSRRNIEACGIQSLITSIQRWNFPLQTTHPIPWKFSFELKNNKFESKSLARKPNVVFDFREQNKCKQLLTLKQWRFEYELKLIQKMNISDEPIGLLLRNVFFCCWVKYLWRPLNIVFIYFPEQEYS